MRGASSIKRTFLHTRPRYSALPRARWVGGCRGDLVRLGAVEAPGADAARGFRLVHDQLEAVSEVEGHVAFRKRLEVAGLAGLVRAKEAVLPDCL
jgi:hypothetical protein